MIQCPKAEMGHGRGTWDGLVKETKVNIGNLRFR